METNQQQSKKRFGGAEKVLIGCGIGCGVVILAFLVAGAMGAFWFFTPGEQIATERIVGEESFGVVRMNELADDAGTQALITKFLTAFQEINRRHQEEALPEEMRWLTRFQRSPRAGDMNRLIPKEATLVLEPAGDGEDPAVVVAANFRTMVRPIKAMFALVSRADDEGEIAAEYRGHNLYRLDQAEDDPPTVTFVGSTLIFASSLSAIEKAIDRVDGVVPGGAERLAREAPEGNWDAAGVLANENDAVLEVIRSLLDDPSLEPPEGAGEDLDLRFGLDVTSADEVTARTVLDCGDPERAAAWLTIVEERLAEVRERMAERQLELDAEAELQGAEVVTRLRLTGLEAAIERMVEELPIE